MRSVIPGLPLPGRSLGTVFVIGALAATLTALLIPVGLFSGDRSVAAARQGWQDDGKGTVNTSHGPLTSLDRDFVRKVRRAGLWELPSGRQAQERGGTEAIRRAGNHLIEGHTELDRRAVDIGRRLGIELPNQPTERQQRWLSEMRDARGDEYARLFANLLRRAHGKIFAVIGLVRDQTRNTLVRSLATRANAVVLDHITQLERTGLVDFSALNEVE